MKKILFPFISICLCLSVTVFAQEKLKCLPSNILFNKNKIIFNVQVQANKGSLYFIHNFSDARIRIDHSNSENPRLSTGWASLLGSDHWSAIILSQKNFVMNCASKLQDKHIEVDCKDYIFVCKTNILKNHRVHDDYWYVEDTTASDFTRAIFAKLKNL